MVRIKEIAEAAGVSISTVSNVLNGRKNVGQSTRARILALCEEMNYYPNISGQSLKSGVNQTILFNFSDFDRSFYLRIINGINDYLEVNGYDLIICTNKNCERYMRSSLTSGCIILDVKMKNDVIVRASGKNYPVIVLDRIVQESNIKSIVVDNYSPMVELMEGMVARGYRSFAFIGGLEDTDDNKERYQAFLDVLDRHNVTFARRFYYSGDYRDKSGYAAAKIMILSRNMPEAVICANDNMAIGAIRAFREKGLSIPRDVAVTGFDGTDIAELSGLTTISIPNYERGYMAAQSMVDLLRGNKDMETLKISASVKWRKTVESKVKIVK